MIDIVSIGNQKVEYKDHSDIEFESLSFYLTLAQKAISKFGKNISPNIAKEMLKSEDAIANIANCIMMADWRWDKDRTGSTGQQKTKYSYRNQCAIWAIKSYISRKYNKKLKSVDIRSTEDDLSILDIMPSSISNPVDILIDQEEKESVSDYIKIILSDKNTILSDKQKLYLKMYYIDNMTFAEIGKRLNITREAVRQGIKKSIEKMNNLC